MRHGDSNYIYWSSLYDQVGNGNSSDVVIKSPVLFLHADNDKIINCNHSRLLHQYRTMLKLPSELFIQASTDTFVKGHNYFDYEKDVLQPSKVSNLYVLYLVSIFVDCITLCNNNDRASCLDKCLRRPASLLCRWRW